MYCVEGFTDGLTGGNTRIRGVSSRVESDAHVSADHSLGTSKAQPHHAERMLCGKKKSHATFVQ